jgi:hypothetical protein
MAFAMPTATRPAGKPEERVALIRLVRAIAAGHSSEVIGVIDRAPGIALASMAVGASRQTPTDFFLNYIGHYVYAGDTALHIAAAAYSADVARRLLSKGANVRARNRRGSEPLHYAADGNPDSPTWDPAAQARVIEVLIGAGADPMSPNRSGATPLHRAVRTRCAAAVKTLLAHGANPRQKNGNGSTAFDLAAKNTGRGGSGSPAARDQQREIIELLRLA